MTNKFSTTNRNFSPLLLIALGVFCGYLVLSHNHSAAYGDITQEQTAPAPQGMQQATFAAGCFWSMEAIFNQLKGVESVFPGYAGGTMLHPSYEEVETGTTGYAETVNITFDPKVISYSELLKVLLTVRNPTTLNQQGNDIGSNYRSVIFYRNPSQKAAAEAAIQEVSSSHAWDAAIVTEVAPFTIFWRAESYHLNYYNLHPDEPYCAAVIASEIADFRSKYRALLKS
jgi:peptide-methionine (S)-S-oxide reductase